jgi:hypothetical protein
VSIVNDLKAASRQNGLGVVQDFVTEAAAAKDMAGLRALIEEACKDLGFDYFALVNHIRFGPPGTSGFPTIRSNGWRWSGSGIKGSIQCSAPRSAPRAASPGTGSSR